MDSEVKQLLEIIISDLSKMKSDIEDMKKKINSMPNNFVNLPYKQLPRVKQYTHTLSA